MSDRLRIVTFNIKHACTGSGRVDLPLLGRTCRGFGADLLALQEVDRRARRSRYSDQVALVARATGLSATFGEAARRGRIRRYGNALLGRGLFSDVEVMPLPRPVAGEPRVAILARLSTDGFRPGALSVAATHLSFRREEGRVQLEAVLDALDRRPLPRVLLGDLNLGPEVVEPAMATAGYELAPTPGTFPAEQPRLRIDYVAVAGLTVAGARAPRVALSDHRPVIADVDAPARRGQETGPQPVR
jgi:endonuclease/exonuclease/phosphatase family metal-dependent hydrolase